MKLFTILFAFFCVTITYGQLLPELNYPECKYKVDHWDAKTVTCPDIPQADYAVVMFRRTFALPDKPEHFIVHVSADNRYKLYVNGILAAMGPQGSDWRHWRYETVDLAPYLQSGNNTVAAEVVNWGPDRWFGIMSIRTMFMMQGATTKESAVNTNAGSQWKAKKNDAYAVLPPDWIFGTDITGGFYATNPGDSVTAAFYPHDWQLSSFDDSQWKPAQWIWNISNEEEGGFFWLMKPRTTPQVAQQKQRFASIARNEGTKISPDFIQGGNPAVAPAHSKTTLLLDYGSVTLGFPELLLSGGKGSKITIRYAENLFNPDLSKGDRNSIEGKHIQGLRDVVVADGRDNFLYSPTWYRAFRFVQMDIETSDEPLKLLDYYQVATASPLNRQGTFECNDSDYMKIDEISRRTAGICTQDNLMSDAYYEQMMYVGDSRVHAMVNLFLTGDDVWLRNAIEQFDYSRMPDGNILGCYPLKATFLTPTFSLVWVDMLHDFMMYCNDKEFVRKYAQSVRSTLNWFDNNRLDNGLMAKTGSGYFVDWYSEPDFNGAGAYPGSGNGNSAVVTLHYAATLLRASEIFDYIGLTKEADTYRAKSEKVKADVIAACWDEKRGLFAENPDKKFFDERTNIMAITAHAFDEAAQRKLLERCLNDSTISKPSYYFRNNEFNELRRLNEGSLIDKVLNVWKDLLPLHLTTTPEMIYKPRSEAHPWSTSPSMAFIKVVAGIAPAEPEYKSVSIEPALGSLKFVKASYPHYLGDIKVELTRKAGNGLEGVVELPKGLKGIFRYNGQSIELTEGKQKINL